MANLSLSRRKTQVAALAFIAVLVCLAFWLSHKALYERLVADTEQTSLERLRFIAATVEQDPGLLKNGTLMRIARERGMRLSYVNADGRVLDDSGVPEAEVAKLDNHKDRLELLLAASDGFGSSVRTSRTLDMETVYTALRLDGGNYLRLAVPFNSVGKSIHEHFRLLFYVGVVGAFLAAFAFFTERHAFRKDLGELSRAVRAIAAGRLRHSVSSLGWAELRPLAGDINIVAERTQKALAEAQDKGCQLQTVFDSIKEGVAIFDSFGGIRAHNEGFSHFFPECRAADRPQAIGCIPIPHLQMSIERVLAGAAPERQSFRAVGVHDEQLLLSLYEPIAPTPDVRIVLIVQDITDLMRLERAQVDFVANVSHELRTPLTAIKGYAEALSEQRYSDEEGRNFARKIERNAAMLHSLVEELLSLAALDDASIHAAAEITTLNECVQQARRLVLESGGCEREIAVPEAPICRVRANKPLLVQAIRNIFDNACAYAPEGSPVTVSIEPRDGTCRLSVADQGPGIPKEFQRRIFERFYRVEKKRTGGHAGLGLAIARQIAERFGGDISVESPATEASTLFILRLPLV